MTTPALPAPPADVVTLAAGGATVEIAPALGGKISSLRLAGREWLWTNDQLPRVAPTPEVAGDDGASYVATADTGGYDECLPTVGACTVEVPGIGRVALPDHGELWAQHAPTERLDAPAASAAAVTRWTGRRLAYAFSRTVTVDAGGDVRMAYELASRAEAAIPFLWSAHPLLPFSPGTRLDLPVAARVRVWSQHGVDLGGAGAEHRWPVLRAGGRDATPFGPHEVDFTFPALATRRFGGAGQDGYSCKLFLDLPRAAAGRTVRLGVEQEGARLEVEVDPAEVPHLGLWLNHGGGTGVAGGRPYYNLGFEPCSGAPDPLDVALGAWQGAQWLAPGETRRWTLTWRGRAAPVG
jgi:galactose mutarotase-like enzyme